jgi:hypothetical protein
MTGHFDLITPQKVRQHTSAYVNAYLRGGGRWQQRSLSPARFPHPHRPHV